MTEMSENENRLNRFKTHSFDLELDGYDDYEPRRTEDVINDLTAEAEKPKPSVEDLFKDQDRLAEKISEHEELKEILDESGDTVQKTREFFENFSEALTTTIKEDADKKIKVIYANQPNDGSWLAEAEESMKSDESYDGVIVLFGNEFRKISDKKFAGMRAERRVEEEDYSQWNIVHSISEKADEVSDKENAIETAVSRTIVISKKDAS